MNVQRLEQRRIDLYKASKTGLRTQFAALCYRLSNGKPEFCLITSRTTRRWIVPKGWPVDGETPTGAAATEAWEEAGLEGKVHPLPAGLFSYVKKDEGLPCVAVVYPLKVKKAHNDWPERDQRRRRWFSRRKAAERVAEPELRQIILTFDPSRH
ncbi:MAG: NUDIX hydrolase [Rhodobacteraceae bacterium HLUCCA08]|nr:MAG: NUDIX hydrolase [Rhodobacteraceae bacterium HLUCCA08]